MKLLAVTLAYPPLAYPRSIQVERLLRHAELPTVVFCADEADARLDHTISTDPEGFLDECFRIPVRRTAFERISGRVIHRVRRSAWNMRNLVPDQYKAWGDDVFDRVAAHIEGGARPGVVVTFAQPFTDHLVGLKIRERYGFPWVAHFSDPWTDNPFTQLDPDSHRANLDLERAVADAADLLVFTTEETVELFCRKYPESVRRKTRVLPQCYDDAAFIRTAQTAADKITIRYLGNFYGHRTPRPLIDALVRLAATEPNELADVAFELIGPGDAADVAEVASGLPDRLLRACPPVDYKTSLELMISADGLLVLDAPAETSVFLPSKLIDYIGSGRPIMGITPAGAARRVINALGGIAASPSDTNEIVSALRQFIAAIRLRRTSGNTADIWGTAEVREQYSAAAIADRFRDLLAEAVGPVRGVRAGYSAPRADIGRAQAGDQV